MFSFFNLYKGLSFLLEIGFRLQGNLVVLKSDALFIILCLNPYADLKASFVPGMF